MRPIRPPAVHVRDLSKVKVNNKSRVIKVITEQ